MSEVLRLATIGAKLSQDAAESFCSLWNRCSVRPRVQALEIQIAMETFVQAARWCFAEDPIDGFLVSALLNAISRPFGEKNRKEKREKFIKFDWWGRGQISFDDVEMKLFHFNGSTVNIEDQKKKKKSWNFFFPFFTSISQSAGAKRKKTLQNENSLWERFFQLQKFHRTETFSRLVYDWEDFSIFQILFFFGHFNELESFPQSAAGFMFTSYSLQLADSNDDWLELLTESGGFCFRAAKFSLYQKLCLF